MVHLGVIDRLLIVVMTIAAIISIVFTIFLVQHARDKVVELHYLMDVLKRPTK